MVNEVSPGQADLEADLPLLEDAFALGPIVVRRYLANGWMNRNWQVAAGDSRYVLKRILAISAGTARSIFAVMPVLNSRAVPVCLPVRSATGETVVVVNDRCYSHDFMVRTLLRRRLELLGEHSRLRPETAAPVGPFGRVHGDLNPRNLLFRGEDVVAVLDWDRMRVSPYAQEVVKAGMAFFGSASGVPDLTRMSAFAAAYRSVRPLDEAALADAVARLWWKRITDVWPAEFRYMRGDRSERIVSMFVLDERTLEWWTRHLADVTAAFAS